MREPVTMPDVGAPAVVSVWHVRPGERVYPGDRLVELLLGDATFEVSSPVGGVWAEATVACDQRVAPGQVLGYLDVAADDS